VGDSKDADGKSQNKKWQQRNSLTVSVEANGSGDFEKCREVADRCVGRDAK
jgi:hypothetical protein